MADLLSGETESMNPALQDILIRLFDLLGDPPMPGIDRPRAIALRS